MQQYRFPTECERTQFGHQPCILLIWMVDIFLVSELSKINYPNSQSSNIAEFILEVN